MNAKLVSFRKLLTQLFIFLLPTQLAYHFWPNWAIIYGLPVDYLAPAVYLSDLIALSLLVLWRVEEKRQNINKLFSSKNIGLFLVVFFIVVNTTLAINPIVAFLKWFRLVLLVLIAIYAKKYIRSVNLEKPLSFSVMLFSLIGIVQVVTQKTIGGPFSYLGERVFDNNTPGISLMSMFGKEVLRPYSTLGHPNALAGYLLVCLVLLSSYKTKDKATIVAIFLGALAFVLTGSLGGYLALLVLLVVGNRSRKIIKAFFLTGIIFSLLLPFVSNLNIEYLDQSSKERIALSAKAIKAASAKPLFGVGINNFVVFSAPEYGHNLRIFTQPVHNIFLLMPSVIATSLVSTGSSRF